MEDVEEVKDMTFRSELGNPDSGVPYCIGVCTWCPVLLRDEGKGERMSGVLDSTGKDTKYWTCELDRRHTRFQKGSTEKGLEDTSDDYGLINY